MQLIRKSVDQLFAHIDQPFPELDVCLFNVSAGAPSKLAPRCWSRLMAAPSSRRPPLRLVEPRLQTHSLFLLGYVQHELEDSCAVLNQRPFERLIRIHSSAYQPSLRRRHVLTAVSTA
jgi:hypothetical protein